MPLLTRKTVFAAKTEGTIGTPETLAAADGGFNAYEVLIQPNIDTIEREAQGGFNRLASVPGARGGTATFKTEISYNGVSDPSWASTLLPACGWVGAASVYTPKSSAPGSDNVTTLTIGAYVDGEFRSIAGAMGTFRIVLTSGQLAMIEWEFQGVWQEPSAVSLIAPTYPTDSPIRFAGTDVTYNSVSMCVQELTVDAGNNLVLRECSDTDAGYKSAIVTDRFPKITANPESVASGTQDRYGDWLAQTQGALAFSLPAPSSTTIDFSIPKAQILNCQQGDREKIVIDEIEFGAHKDGATNDQELSITFS